MGTVDDGACQDADNLWAGEARVAIALGAPRRTKVEPAAESVVSAAVGRGGQGMGTRLEGSLVLAPSHLKAAFMAEQEGFWYK